jgi:hypothetical protein
VVAVGIVERMNSGQHRAQVFEPLGRFSLSPPARMQQIVEFEKTILLGLHSQAAPTIVEGDGKSQDHRHRCQDGRDVLAMGEHRDGGGIS